ncbi:sugar phosphate isomerase/epimerase family protein [Sphingobium sp. YR768]|uniref:sugar phosphate isomerase/epimerase family protein n=1 Tax=Sphingobium sp. YR768 TaxID=1884365 RepID=UPI0008D0059E|nr:sugar phosphate isomerase/epimerase [Sphingobium sp. YR768]SES20147.1 Sugar phosphate isomerase/epimerase [Sphingobium sp. YR768]
MVQYEFGIQTFALGQSVKDDPHAAFGRLADLGYSCIETAGLHGHSATNLAFAAREAGMRIDAMHVQPQLQLDPADHRMTDEVGPIIDDLLTIGASRVVMPLCLIPEDKMPSRQGNFGQELRKVVLSLGQDVWHRSAEFLNLKGQQFTDAGIKLYYHNHDFEFADYDGKSGWNILWDETDNELVQFEIDLGWVIMGGRDPIEELRRGAGRIGMIHAKNTYHIKPLVPGEKRANWEEILRVAKETGVDRFFIEVEGPFATNAWDATARAFDDLDIAVN